MPNADLKWYFARSNGTCCEATPLALHLCMTSDWLVFDASRTGRQVGTFRPVDAEAIPIPIANLKLAIHSRLWALGPFGRRPQVKCTRNLHKFARWLWTWTNRQIFNLPQAMQLSTDKTRVFASPSARLWLLLCLLYRYVQRRCQVLQVVCSLFVAVVVVAFQQVSA